MASLLDVFNASARVFNQGADIYVREQKEAADLYLQNRMLSLQMAGNRFLHNVEIGAISNDNDDYTGAWESEVNKWYQESLKGAKNKYTIKALDRMFQFDMAKMLPELEAAGKKQRSLRNTQTLDENIALNNETAKSTAKKIGDAAAWIGHSFEIGDTDHAVYIPKVKGTYLSIGQDEVRGLVDRLMASGYPYDQALREVENFIQRELPQTINLKNPKGGGVVDEATRPRAPEGAEEIDVRQRVDDDIARMRDTEGSELHTLSGQIDQLDTPENRRTGQPGERRRLYQEKEDELRQELTAKYTGERDARGKKQAAYQTALSAWEARQPRPTQGFTDESFDTRAWNEQIRGAGINYLDSQWSRRPKAERTTLSEVIRTIQSVRDASQKGAIAHNYRGQEVDAEQAFAMYQAEIDAIVLGSGYSLDDKENLFSKEIGVHTWFTDLGKSLKEMDPNFTETSLIPLEAVITSIAKSNGLSEEMKKTLSRQVTTALFNVIWDTGLYSRSTEKWVALGKEMAEKTAAGKIDIVALTKDGKSQLKNLTGNPSDADRIALYERAHENPEAISETGGRLNYLGNFETYQNLQGWAAKDIVRRLEMPAEIADTGNVRVGWDRETGKNDFAPIPTVTITGTGTGKDGVYKYDLKKLKTFYGREYNGLALYKKDSQGKWQEIGTGTAEAHTENLRIGNFSDRLDTMLEPKARENIAKLLSVMKKPAYFQDKSRSDIKRDIANIAGVNRASIKQVLLYLVENGVDPFRAGPGEDMAEIINGLYPGMFTGEDIFEISRLRGTR
jgi:hypothetical protein